MRSKNLLFCVGFGEHPGRGGGRVGVQSYSKGHLWCKSVRITGELRGNAESWVPLQTSRIRILETGSRDLHYSSFAGYSYVHSSLRNTAGLGHVHFTGVGTYIQRPGLGPTSREWLNGTGKHIGPLGSEECSSVL